MNQNQAYDGNLFFVFVFVFLLPCVLLGAGFQKSYENDDSKKKKQDGRTDGFRAAPGTITIQYVRTYLARERRDRGGRTTDNSTHRLGIDGSIGGAA